MVMYPAFGSFLIRRPTTDPDGRTFTDNQTYDENTIRFDLWCEEEPEEYALIDQTIAQSLT